MIGDKNLKKSTEAITYLREDTFVKKWTEDLLVFFQVLTQSDSIKERSKMIEMKLRNLLDEYKREG